MNADSPGRRPKPQLPELGNLCASHLEDTVQVLRRLIEAKKSLDGSDAVNDIPYSDGPRLDGGVAGAAESRAATDRSALRTKAIELYAEREQRYRFFARAMFREPAWDMLLALYIRDWAGARFTIATLSEHTRTSLSSAVRWIAYLSRERLVVREDHPTDRRKSFIAISEKGRRLLDRYLEGGGELANDV